MTDAISPKRQLVEGLARYLDPDAFNGRRRSKRNSDAAFRARKHAMKQARAAMRFFALRDNLGRLAAIVSTPSPTPSED